MISYCFTIFFIPLLFSTHFSNCLYIYILVVFYQSGIDIVENGKKKN